MNLACFIIDKGHRRSVSIEEYLGLTPGLECVHTTVSIDDALAVIGAGQKVPDVLFVEAGLIQNVDIVKLRTLSKDFVLIVTGDKGEDAALAYRCDAVDFLQTPMEYTYFLEAVQKAKSVLENRQRPITHLFVKDALNGTLVKVDISDIVYLESLGNYVKIIYGQGKYYLIHLSLVKLLKCLPRTKFCRVHQSAAVNIEQIVNLDKEILNLKYGLRVKIGNSYRKDFLDLLMIKG